jgi:alpha-ribazole phosphatase
MKLWIVRHAKPLIASGVCYGALNVAADELLTQQAAHSLAQALPMNVNVQVSPLQRCMQMADALSEIRPDLKLQTDERLREMDFGSWEGVLWDAIPSSEMHAWTEDFGAHRFGGVESANGFMARVAKLWDAALADGAQSQAWITHAGVARAAKLLAQGIRTVHSASQWPVDAPGYGQWHCIDY